MIHAEHNRQYYPKGKLELKYDAGLKCVVIAFRGYVSSHMIREVHEQALYCMQSYNTTKVLTDLGELDEISYEDQCWLARHWLPEARVAGYAAAAIIMPVGVISYITSLQLVNVAQSDTMAVRIFRLPKEAQQWISQYR